MQDYANMVRQLMLMATPVADKNNPLQQRLNPYGLSEGARAYPGGTETMPLKDFINGRVMATQNTVDARGIAKYRKAIEKGWRPAIEISPNSGTRYSDRSAEYRITDGHTRLQAYYELGIPEIPVIIKK